MSDYVLKECGRGDKEVAKRRLDLIKAIEALDDTPDVDPLADTYMRILSIPQKARIDALHLAICSLHEINILLSWNCSHLGVENMLRVKKHNDAHGLSTPKMITPDALVEKYMEVDFDE